MSLVDSKLKHIFCHEREKERQRERERKKKREREKFGRAKR